jgi:hypothetical protein
MIQYRLVGNIQWNTLALEEIGSGSTPIEVSAQLLPTLPRKRYEALVTATNQYGASSLATTFGLRWLVKEWVGRINTSSYFMAGTFSIKWEPLGGYHGHLQCSEEGYGECGPKATSESTHLSMYNCFFYVNNEFVCSTAKKRPQPQSEQCLPDDGKLVHGNLSRRRIFFD